MSAAAIDIGLPVYNAAASIDRTIASIRAQTLADFRLLISDNASTDGTQAIIERHAAQDSRIRFTPHATNRGAYENFHSLLRDSQADYFVFIASDDWWSPDFLEKTYAGLCADPDATCCAPRTAFYSASGKFLHVTPSTSSITYARAKDRAEHFLIHPTDCSRFYGLHRTDILRRVFDGGDHFASDWCIVLRELMIGTHLETPQVLLHRTAAPLDRYAKQWRASNRGLFLTRKPLGPMRRVLKQKLSPREYRSIWLALWRLDNRLARELRTDERRMGRPIDPHAKD